MVRKTIVLLSVAAVITLGAVPAFAGSLYVGGGFANVGFGVDLQHGKWYEVKNTTGYFLNVGYELSPTLAIDVRATVSEHNEATIPSKPKYQAIEIGPRFLFSPGSNIQPSITVGVGSHSVDMGSFEYDGTGAFIDLALQEIASDKHSLRVSARGSYWVADLNTFDILTYSFGLVYNYHLGR